MYELPLEYVTEASLAQTEPDRPTISQETSDAHEPVTVVTLGTMHGEDGGAGGENGGCGAVGGNGG